MKAWFILIILLLIVFSCYLFLEKGKNFKLSEPSVAIPNGIGVNIHFAGKQIDIDMIGDAGFNMVRTDLFWSAIETNQGVYDFKNNGYDTLTRELIKKNITPYYVLDYSNTLYEKHGSAIVTQRGREAFNRYVDQVTKRYKNKNIIWEVWNEPNTNSWVPKPNTYEYFLLLKEASKTIKENDPSGIVVAPALAGMTEESFKWLEEILKQGALEYVDAISVHPYRADNPESVSSEYQSLRALIKKYSTKPIPIISGEWGYSTANGWYGLHLTEEEQAAYLVRMFLINKLEHIPISIWYDWKNDGGDPNNGYHNFGLRQENVAVPKLAYQAANTFTYFLSEYKLMKRIDLGHTDDYLLTFINRKGEKVLVMWTSRNTHEISFPLTNMKGHVFSMLGEDLGYFNSKHHSVMKISKEPIYLIME